MTDSEAHPGDPDGTAAWHRPLHHTPRGTLDPATAQTPGMERFEALSARHGGTERIWMGENHVGLAMSSGDHHHGEPAVVVLARSTQEGIVVNLPSLWASVEPDGPSQSA